MYRLYKGELRAKGDAVDSLFQIWLRTARYLRHERAIRDRVRSCTRRWEQDLGIDISEARKAKDPRRVWQLMRQLGGTGRRERKRNVRDVTRDDPSTKE